MRLVRSCFGVWQPACAWPSQTSADRWPDVLQDQVGMRCRVPWWFGYDYNDVVDALQGLNGENGAYTYATLGDFVADLLAPDSCDGTTTGTGSDPCYARFRQMVGMPNWSFSTADYAAYAADEWKPERWLTLTLGVRYEYERVPEQIRRWSTRTFRQRRSCLTIGMISNRGRGSRWMSSATAGPFCAPVMESILRACRMPPSSAR